MIIYDNYDDYEDIYGDDDDDDIDNDDDVDSDDDYHYYHYHDDDDVDDDIMMTIVMLMVIMIVMTMIMTCFNRATSITSLNKYIRRQRRRIKGFDDFLGMHSLTSILLMISLLAKRKLCATPSSSISNVNASLSPNVPLQLFLPPTTSFAPKQNLEQSKPYSQLDLSLDIELAIFIYTCTIVPIFRLALQTVSQASQFQTTNPLL